MLRVPKRTAIAAAMTVLLLSATACTPDQVEWLGLSDTPAAPALLALDDAPMPVAGGHVQPDGSFTAYAGYVHPWSDVQRWHDTAINAGWPEAEWQWLSCVMGRESRGEPSVWNKRDPAGGSIGLMQINRSNVGYLKRAGAVTSWQDLFDPAINLKAAWTLSQAPSGKGVLGHGPWRSSWHPC